MPLIASDTVMYVYFTERRSKNVLRGLPLLVGGLAALIAGHVRTLDLWKRSKARKVM
jgi:hypothetical protein